jgi:hypothetical protein
MPQHEAKTLAVEYTRDAALAIAIETQRKKEGRKTVRYRTSHLEVVQGYEDRGPVPNMDVSVRGTIFVVVSWMVQ